MTTPPAVRMLQERARLLARAREFFAARAVLEVDTPLLGQGLVVEAHIDPIPCQIRAGTGTTAQRHLLTSPEGPMKRLLAMGSGPIYQFAHAFRDGEAGQRHAPEFSMLEWYRPGLDHLELMEEVQALVQALLPAVAGQSFQRRTYQQVFVETCDIDPFTATLAELRTVCERLGVPTPPGFAQGSVDDALDLLLVAHIEPTLGNPVPTFVYEYPASQAALAQVHENSKGHRVAQRFELYIDGVELANGYHELADASEQRRRFEQANRDRKQLGRAELPLDEPLLEALTKGLPACSGVALGFDRLLMLATGSQHIEQVRPVG